MGKQGPCRHCGVTTTPLWRNGPPEKPILCNACGSRWRTKGTLANYTPLHSRADPDDYEDHSVSRVKTISINRNKDVKLVRGKVNCDNEVVGGDVYDYSQGYQKLLDEDASNRSSSGSAISNSESCAQFGYAFARDLTGSVQSVVWDSMVPSKKRTSVNRSKQSPVEKLTKDLYTILHEQQYFSVSSEEDLLFQSEAPMVSVEIGHGSVLIQHPSSIPRDEESEASSLSVENKQHKSNESYSNSVSQPAKNDNSNVHKPSLATENTKIPIGQMMQQEQLKRDNSCLERVPVLGNHNSPLCNVDLKDIVNFEEFVRYLTNEEQQELLKYLPPVDTAELPDSIKSMFDSHQFKENISYYQQLLSEGVFDLSLLGAKSEDSSTLKKLTLTSLSKSKWVEHYHQLKKLRNSSEKPFSGRGTVVSSCNPVTAKRSRDISSQTNIDIQTVKSPKRISIKAIDNDGTCFSPRSLFNLPPDSGSLMLDSLHYVDENPDHDLLVNVPSNGTFPQAELLHPALSFPQQATTSSSSRFSHLVHP